MCGCVLPPMKGRLSVHLPARPQFSVDCPCQITVGERVPCLSNIFRSLCQRGFANADFQIFIFPPFIVSSANRDFSFYVSAYFNFSTQKKRVLSTLTSFCTQTTSIAIILLHTVQPRLLSQGKSVGLWDHRVLSVCLSVCERISPLSVFRGAGVCHKVIFFSSIQLVAIAWRTREMIKWDRK